MSGDAALEWFAYKTRPFPYQEKIFLDTRDRRAHALFLEMGTGKSKIAIDTAAHLWDRRLVQAVVVVAPNMVHRNWVTDEIPRHCPDRCRSVAMDWHSSRAATRRQRDAEDRILEPDLARRPRLRWLAVSYDAIKTPRGRDFTRRFVTAFPQFMIVVDESTRAKSPGSQRSRLVLALAKLAAYRRILTGTPVANGPFDVYQQIRILDEDFWYRHGLGTYAAFCSRFGVFREIEVTSGATKQARAATTGSPGRGVDDPGCAPEDVDAFERLMAGAIDDAAARLGADPGTVSAVAELVEAGAITADDAAGVAAQPTARRIKIRAAYRDVEKIHEMIAPISTRVTKEDAGLGLPPKLYNRLPVELAPEQRRAYDELRRTYMLELDGGQLVTATMAIVRVLRLQQIACGYLPDPNDPDGEPILMATSVPEPRLAALLDLLDDVPHKAIVWARFRVDVDRICAALGDRCARIDGRVTSLRDRDAALARFRDPNGAQFFVANPAAIATGITLVEAKTVVYYSNSHYLEHREQSEDRAHRIGQDRPVLYYDLIAEDTVDEKIVRSLREKKQVAALVVGDQFREWLE